MVEDTNPLEEADIALGNHLASRRNEPAVRTATKLGKLGDQGPLYAVSAAMIILGFASCRARLAAAGFSMLAAVAAADAGKTITKNSVRRTRPHILLDNGRYTSGVGGSSDKQEQSFPSGHLACTLAAARAFSRYYQAGAPWAAGATVMIAGARLAKGAHWPLDVAAGAVIGLLAEGLTDRLLRRLGLQRERICAPHSHAWQGQMKILLRSQRVRGSE